MTWNKRLYLLDVDGELPDNVGTDATEAFAILFKAANEADLYLADTAEAMKVCEVATALGLEGAYDFLETLKIATHLLEANAWSAANLYIPHRHLFNENATGTGLASKCQYPRCEVMKASVEAELHEQIYLKRTGRIPHEHVFSSVGRCMYLNCFTKEGDTNATTGAGTDSPASGT